MKATNDKYVNESVTYLTGKRNHLFLRGKNVSELPTVDALERKLEGVVKEDKGSPKTKIFVPETAKTAESVDFLSTKRLKSTSLLLPLGDSLRERLFRLSQNLKRSKMSNRGVRNGERRLPRMAA